MFKVDVNQFVNCIITFHTKKDSLFEMSLQLHNSK